jgi:hypothetical protein
VLHAVHVGKVIDGRCSSEVIKEWKIGDVCRGAQLINYFTFSEPSASGTGNSYLLHLSSSGHSLKCHAVAVAPLPQPPRASPMALLITNVCKQDADRVLT